MPKRTVHPTRLKKAVRLLSRDELLSHDNLQAKKPIPKDLLERFRTPTICVSSMGSGRSARKLSPAITNKDAHWAIELPSNTFVGLEAKSAQPLHTKTAHKAPRSSVLNGFHPAWMPTIYHPKLISTGRGFDPRARRRRRVPTGQGVFGSDDRAVFFPIGYPNQCVGKLFVGTSPAGFNLSGTATLVGSRTIITAGHMVPWGASFWQALFVPGFFDGGSVLGPGVQSFVTEARGWNDSVSEYDLAVMRLDQPLGDQLGFFGALWYDDAQDDDPLWTLIGYPGAIAGGARPSMQIGIPVLDRDMNDDGAMELEHHGDSTPGDSGGPLWAWSTLDVGTGPFLAGVQSGYEEEDFLWWSWDEDNIAAGGNSMLDLIWWARANWG